LFCKIAKKNLFYTEKKRKHKLNIKAPCKCAFISICVYVRRPVYQCQKKIENTNKQQEKKKKRDREHMQANSKNSNFFLKRAATAIIINFNG
jgi:hypothetical protein